MMTASRKSPKPLTPSTHVFQIVGAAPATIPPELIVDAPAGRGAGAIADGHTSRASARHVRRSKSCETRRNQPAAQYGPHRRLHGKIGSHGRQGAVNAQSGGPDELAHLAGELFGCCSGGPGRDGGGQIPHRRQDHVHADLCWWPRRAPRHGGLGSIHDGKFMDVERRCGRSRSRLRPRCDRYEQRLGRAVVEPNISHSASPPARQFTAQWICWIILDLALARA